MRRKQTNTKYEPAIYQDDPDAIATVNVFDPDNSAVIPVEVGYYYHGKTGSTIYLLNDPRTKQMLWEASEIHLTRFFTHQAYVDEAGAKSKASGQLSARSRAHAIVRGIAVGVAAAPKEPGGDADGNLVFACQSRHQDESD